MRQEKIQLPILRFSTLERAFLERGLSLSCWVKLLFLTLAEMGLPFPGQSSSRAGRMGYYSVSGWIFYFRVNIQSVPWCSPAQPTAVSKAELWVCLWMSLHPNFCSVSLPAALWVQNLWGESLPKLNLPSYMEESPVQASLPGRGRREPAGTGYHQVCKIYRNLKRKTASGV